MHNYVGKLANRKYYMAIIRYNGISNSTIFDCSKYVFSEMNERIFTFGRDDKENLYICPEEVVDSTTFLQMLQNRIKKDTAETGYSTMVMHTVSIPLERLQKCKEQLYEILRANIVIGKTQIIDTATYKNYRISYSADEKDLWLSYYYYLERKELKKEKESLIKLFQLFKKEERPLAWIMTQLIRIQYNKMQGINQKTFENIQEIDMEILDEVAISSVNIEQLWSGVEAYFYAEKEAFQQIDKLDTEEFINIICLHLHENMKIAISIEDVSKRFNVSATYLAKLFKKHKGVTLNTYLTMLRMEEAKRLMECVDNILIKDIAEQLGYKDQFYFSRVFRSYTGKSPSDYIEIEKRKP